MRLRPGQGGSGAERGATLIEFAIVLPLLIILVFGIIEASWAFAQHNDVRHGAREGARLAAVNFGNVATIGQAVCDRMDVVYPSNSPDVTLEGIGSLSTVGGLGEITVESELQTLTGLLDGFFGGIDLTSTIEFRLEQPASGAPAWWGGGTYTC